MVGNSVPRSWRGNGNVACRTAVSKACPQPLNVNSTVFRVNSLQCKWKHIVNWYCLLPPANEVAGRLCFYRCLWFCSQEGGGVSQYALQVVSQHALQVSRGVYPSMPSRFPGPHPRGSLRGLARGVSRPTPRRAVSKHALRQPPSWWLLLRAVRILLECILVFHDNFSGILLLNEPRLTI